MNLKLLLIVLVFGVGTTLAQTQDVIATSGNYSETSNVSLSWTLGEGVIETQENPNVILTQGFQQSRYTITSVEEQTSEIGISVYPNPTSDFLKIEIKDDKAENMSVELIDITGKSLITKDLKNKTSVIDMQQYVSGNYLLRVNNKESKEIKVYKIIKNY